MRIILHAARLSLPALFFGYAVVANLSLLGKPLPEMALNDGSLLSGGLTNTFDSTYKSALPHVAPSFGLIGAARYALLDEARQGAIVGSDGWLFTAEETRPLPTDADLTTIAAQMQDIRDQLHLGGTELVIVLLPAKIDIARSHSADMAWGEALEGLYDRVTTRLADEGLVVVNARAAIAAGNDPGFFATDTHWTPEGAMRVANAVARSGAIRQGNLTYRREAAPSVTLTGDLVAFVTTPGLAPHVGLAPERIVPVVQTPLTASDDIFGAVGFDIVLVGTSYSANPDWGFADALMLALGRDVVSLAEQGRGPLAPMQDYLASADFTAAPPAVVIWEVPIRYLTDPAIWKGSARPAPGLASSLTGQNADG